MATLHALRTEGIVYERLRQGREILKGLIRDTLRRAVRGSVPVEQAIAAVETWLDPGKAPKVMAGVPLSRQAERVLGLLPGGAGYQARRIMITESSRAHGEARVQFAREQGHLLRWMLAPSHPRTDICDPIAERDVGFGPGVFLPGDAPQYPAHPLCRCVMAVVEPTDAQRERMGRLQGGGGPPSQPPSRPPGGADEPPGRRGMGDIPIPARELLVDGGSAASYLESNGRFTPARQAFHDDIVRHFTSRIPRSPNRTVFMLGGGPAAGKSTMLDSGKLNVPRQEVDAVLVDPDAIKKLIPEYGQMIDAGNRLGAAPHVHEESSYVAKRVLRAALENGQDAVVDGVGVNYERIIAEARPEGYTVRGYYAYLPDPGEAVRRASARFVEKGRFVPEPYIRERHQKVSQIFPDAAKKLDSIELYDTSRGARLVARGHGGELVIIDSEAYEIFLSIGRAEP